MSDEVHFLSYEQASHLVAAIQEEENIRQADHRVLTVYNHDNKEICWFDFEEVMADVGVKKLNDESRAAVTEYIMHRIPDWALDI